MIAALTFLLACQLAGELAAEIFGLPIPGPVLGFLLMSVYLVVRRDVWSELRTTSSTLLIHLSLLFVPAGVGITRYLPAIRAEWLAISGALLISTMLTILVSAFAFRLTAKFLGMPQEDG